jgi:electron transport complex protein RnfB
MIPLLISLLIAILFLGILGFLMGIGLGFASKKFAVPVDPRIEALGELLPGVNCGACGFPGCINYAKAIIEDGVALNACTVGGTTFAKKAAEILGVEATTNPEHRHIARIHCNGDLSPKRGRGAYEGTATCLAATTVPGGIMMCIYGCLGFGDCIRVCPFGAITPRHNKRGEIIHPPEINPEKCTGCGNCVKACPKCLIQLRLPDRPYIACSSLAPAKIVRAVCDIGCIACGICVKKCPNASIVVEKNLAWIDDSQCRLAGECVPACPRKCIIWTK